MTNTKRRKQKDVLIWAVDVLGDLGVQAPAARLIQSLNRRMNCIIEPVFVLSGSTRARGGIHYFLPKAEAALKELIEKYRSEAFQELKILIQSSGFLRNDVKALLSYAKKRKATAIIVSTQAKKGVARLFLGSFAETLILHSNIPVLIVGPKAPVGTALSPCLFATDFSDASWLAFRTVVNWASRLTCKITLFHQFQDKNTTVPKNVLYRRTEEWLPAEEDLTEQALKHVQSESRKWITWAKQRGVSCTLMIQYGSVNVGNAIIKANNSGKFKLIALAAQTGPIASTIVGSTTRHVVRSANCPVWVLYVSNTNKQTD